MATTFFTSTRGCVYVQEPAGGGSGGGFYQLRGGSGAAFGEGSKAFITGSDFVIGDIISAGVALDRSKIISVFGEDWGSSTVNGIVLLGQADEGGKALEVVTDFFRANRVSKKKEPCSLSIPGNKAYSVYLHRLLLNGVDAEYHIQPFSISVSVDEA